jgi:hypothetical protein
MSFICFTQIHYLQCLAPPWEQNLCLESNEIHNFGRGLPVLHHYAFSFSYIHVVEEKVIFCFFFKLVNFHTFYPAPKTPGGKLLHFLPRPQEERKPEIHTLCPPCLKDASLQI